MGLHWVGLEAPVSENFDILTFSQANIFFQKKKSKKRYREFFKTLLLACFRTFICPPHPYPRSAQHFLIAIFQFWLDFPIIPLLRGHRPHTRGIIKEMHGNHRFSRKIELRGRGKRPECPRGAGNHPGGLWACSLAIAGRYGPARRLKPSKIGPAPIN